jgi:hypothetical protein
MHTHTHVCAQVRGAERAMMACLRALLDAGSPEGLQTSPPLLRHEPLPSTGWPAAACASRPVSVYVDSYAFRPVSVSVDS